VDTSSGATRAELDALRLAAILLAHWDNKSANQRLVCTAPSDAGTGRCPRPFALVHDVGATFGPKKVNLARWAAMPVWTDPARCVVSMRDLPYNGGTFPDSSISEAGRRLLAGQLASLGRGRIASLFEAARFTNPAAWVDAFEAKVRQIASAGPCPS
jgi:hypothetical protein